MTLLTIEEARQKPCPFFRYCINETGVIQDRDSAIYVHQNCMTAECIAWRFSETPEFKARADAEFQKNGKRIEPETGYCGIAGLPS